MTEKATNLTPAERQTQAKALKNNVFLQEAVHAHEKEIVANWAASSDVAAREACHAELRAVGRFRQILDKAIEAELA